MTINSTTVPVTITVENPLVWLPAPEASIADDCESGGAVVTLRNTGGGDVVYQIIVDGESFGPTHTVGSGGEEVVTVPLGEDQTATITVVGDTPVDVTVPMTEDQTSTITVKDGETTVLASGLILAGASLIGMTRRRS